MALDSLRLVLSLLRLYLPRRVLLRAAVLGKAFSFLKRSAKQQASRSCFLRLVSWCISSVRAVAVLKIYKGMPTIFTTLLANDFSATPDSSWYVNIMPF
jgi:hypothetical protein